MGWIKVEDGKTSKLRVAMAGREDPKPVMVFHSFRWVNQWLGTVCNLLQFSRISEVAFRI
uniref:Uncharacterized protein n=1 Tax=Vitis vinifera TaxID=29760 RepID=F6I3C4_VITVI